MKRRGSSFLWWAILPLFLMVSCGKSQTSTPVDVFFDLSDEGIVSSQSALLALVEESESGEPRILENTSLKRPQDLELFASMEENPEAYIVLLVFAEALDDVPVTLVRPEEVEANQVRLLPTKVFLSPLSQTGQLTPVASGEYPAPFLATFVSMVHIDRSVLPVEEEPPPPVVSCSNVALGKSVTASDSYPGTDPAFITDGIKDGPYWSGRGTVDPFSHYVTIDLGAEYTISELVVRPLGHNLSTYFYNLGWSATFALNSNGPFLSFSNVIKVRGGGVLAGDGLNIKEGWPSSSDGISSGHDPAYDEYEFTFEPVVARYVQLQVTSGDRDGDSNFDEVEVCGI